MTRRQCKKCPWKKSTDPYTIPNYDPQLHAQKLQRTIARHPLDGLGEDLRLMACHETPIGRELPCAGWLVNQLSSGNNIALRLAAREGRVDVDVQLVGPQHLTFEDTVPKEYRRGLDQLDTPSSRGARREGTRLRESKPGRVRR